MSDEEEIVTSDKGITLPTLSMSIWVATNILYGLLHLLFVKATDNYSTWTFVISLLLSIVCGIFLISKMIKEKTQPKKAIFIILNIVMLYTSANGIQAGYSVISTGNQPKSATNDPKALHSGFSIPFINSRPWIPDKFLENENKNLASDKTQLQTELDSLLTKRNTIDVSNNNASGENRTLLEEISRLKNDYDNAQKKIDILMKKIQSHNDSVTMYIKRSSRVMMNRAYNLSPGSKFPFDIIDTSFK